MKYYRDNNGNVFAYESDGSQDNLIGDKLTMTAQEVEDHINPPKTTSQVIQHFTNLTTKYIEDKIAQYNTANGVAFADIDAFTKYAVVATSSHNAIAIKFITYADNIWKKAREYQATATAIPTDIEFKVVLDSVVF